MRTQSKTINLLEVWESASYQVGIDLSFASDWLRGTWSLTKGGGGEEWVSYEGDFECAYLTNRFQVAVHLFNNRSQMTSKCGKNKKVAHKAQPSVSLMFLPHFDVLCDLLLNRRTATWNLFVLYNKELKKVLMMTSSIHLSSNRSYVRTNQNAYITELIT